MSRPSRSLADLGERALIERITRRAGLPPGRDWILGIGDDAAILRPRAGDELVFSTDAQVEGVHFRFEREGPRGIGRRALAVNLSDLAAMGAEPVGALLGLALPASLGVSTFDGVIGGLVDEGARWGCPLVGGNLSRASECSLSITVIGRCRRGRALRRAGAKTGLRAGDTLFVTGALGRGVLARLKADRSGGRLRYVPTPRLRAGRALARRRDVRACIDLSDGLATDLGNLLGDSGLGAEIEPSALPMPRGFVADCRALEADPLGLIAHGGEDYELLFALAGDRKRGKAQLRALAKQLGTPVHPIGQIVAEPGVRGLPAAGAGHHF